MLPEHFEHRLLRSGITRAHPQHAALWRSSSAGLSPAAGLHDRGAGTDLHRDAGRNHSRPTSTSRTSTTLPTKIGDVDDVLIDKVGNVTAMIIAVGRFLGMGEKAVAAIKVFMTGRSRSFLRDLRMASRAADGVFTLPAAFSAAPSACVFASPVTLPTASLTAP